MIIDWRPEMIQKVINLTEQNVKDLNDLADMYGYDEEATLNKIVQEGITRWINQIYADFEANNVYDDSKIPDIPDYSIPPWDRD